MSETTQGKQIQAHYHHQLSLALNGDVCVVEAVLSDTEPRVHKVPTSGNCRSTSDFPPNPSVLSRKMLEAYYRDMRQSHISLARSRGQHKRYSKQFSRQRNELFKTLRVYQEKIVMLGREKVEVMQLAKSFQRDLDAFERKDQALTQILNDLEDATEKTGFWSIFTIAQLLERMRQLLRAVRPGQ